MKVYYYPQLLAATSQKATTGENITTKEAGFLGPAWEQVLSFTCVAHLC